MQLLKKRNWVKCAECLCWYDNNTNNTTCPRCGSHELKVITQSDIDAEEKAKRIVIFATSVLLLILFVVAAFGFAVKINKSPLGYDKTTGLYYQRLMIQFPTILSAIIPLGIIIAKSFISICLYKKGKSLFFISLIGTVICLVLFVLISSGALISRNYG